MEKALQEANEVIAANAKLSRELSNAQREIRELNRRFRLQAFLQPVSSTPYSVPLQPASISRGDSDMQEKIQLESKLSCNSQLFLNLSDPVLFVLFGFLEANSVLSASQTCYSIFERLRNMFGIRSRVNRVKKVCTGQNLLDIQFIMYYSGNYV